MDFYHGMGTCPSAGVEAVYFAFFVLRAPSIFDDIKWLYGLDFLPPEGSENE